MKKEWTNDNITETIEIITSEAFKQNHPELFNKTLVNKSIDDIHFCKANHYKNITSGSFVLPAKENPAKNKSIFAFCIAENTLYFIDDNHVIPSLLEKMNSEVEYSLTTPLMFLLDFMQFLVQDDVYYLQKYEENLSKLEDELKHGKAKNLNAHLMDVRKDLNALGMYYEQLSDLAATLDTVVLQEKNELGSSLLALFIARVKQLYSMVQTIKDFTAQINNLSQSIIAAKQNNITNLLTGVTTIFLPLTLVTGWFGMNFTYLPLIHSRAGFIGTCWFVFICIILEIIIFWKNNLFK